MAQKNQLFTVFEIFYILGLIILSAKNARCQSIINPRGTHQLLKSCVVPNYKGTTHFLPGCTGKGCSSIAVGQSIAGNGSILGLKCADSFILREKHVDMTVCYDGEWYPKRHACQRTCQGINLNTLEKNCTYKGEPVSCDTEIRIGTKARVACKAGFQTDRDLYDHQENHCLKTGKWLYIMYNCAPICGEIEEDGKSRNKGGFRNVIESISANHAPWNAAVYLVAHNGTITMICGGTLISEEFIITAAKCVNDKSGSVKNASVLRVALGKTYKDWNDTRDSSAAQKFEVEGILHEKLFEIIFGGNKEIIDFARHIVVLRVKGMVNFDKFVAPVCLDVTRLNERIPDLIGTIVGWSMNNNDSVRLTRFRRQVENNAVCKNKLKPHEAIDNPSKFCTQRIEQLGNYLGAGLTFNDNAGTAKHYVIGIMTDHFDDVTVYLGFRDDSSASIINLLRFYFDRATDVKSVQ